MVVDRSIRVRVGFIHRDGIVPSRVSTELKSQQRGCSQRANVDVLRANNSEHSIGNDLQKSVGCHQVRLRYVV